jgi:two-component sensor histidine kinase
MIRVSRPPPSRSTAAVINGDWHGANIRDLIRVHLAPFHNARENCLDVDGPELRLNPKAAEQIGLAFHELGTNALKHGALSGPSGSVKIRWDFSTGELHDPLLRIVWEEVGGPRVGQPKRQGFGHVVLTKVVPGALQGQASLEFKSHGSNRRLSSGPPTCLPSTNIECSYNLRLNPPAGSGLGQCLAPAVQSR